MQARDHPDRQLYMLTIRRKKFWVMQNTRSLGTGMCSRLAPGQYDYGARFSHLLQLFNPSLSGSLLHHGHQKSPLDILSYEKKSDVIEYISGTKVNITMDLWTSIGARGYVTVTAHSF